MDNAHDFDAAGYLTVKNQVLAYRPAPHSFAQFRQRTAESGVSGEQNELLIYMAKHRIGRRRIVLRDNEPNFDKVFFRLRGAKKAGHELTALA